MYLILNKAKIRVFLSSSLIILFLIANFLRMQEKTALPYLLVLSVSGIIGWCQFLYSSFNKTKIFAVFIVMFTSTMFNGVFIGNVDIGELFNVFCFFGLLFCFYTSELSPKVAMILMVYCVAFFILAWFKNPFDPQVFSSSRNYNSVILILFACIYYTVYENNNKKIRLWPAILIFLLSVWSMGRGGILSTLVLVLGILFLRFRTWINKSKYSKIIYSLLGLFVFILVLALLVKEGAVTSILDNTIFKLGKFSYAEKNFGDSARSILWGEYFSKALDNILYTVMGAPLDQCAYVHSFENNTHNSFIQLHAYNGFISFAIIVILVIRAEIYFWTKSLNVHFLMLNVLLLRAMTDKFIFFQYGFPFLMYFLFYQDAKSYIHKGGQNLS